MFTVAVARFDATRAVTITEPLATPVTRPALDTVATLVLEEDQLFTVPGMTRPLSSSKVAASCSEVFALIELFVGEMRMEPMVFCFTAIVADPDAVPTLAFSVTSPSPVVVTTPFSSTMAIVESDIDQRIGAVDDAADRSAAIIAELTVNCT